MTHKIISFIFVISFAFGITVPNQVKDVPFDVNEVINRASPHSSLTSNPYPLTPELTGEFLIDTSIVYVPAHDDQGFPSIAFDGTNYLVVWTDGRSGSSDIYCARVNQSGSILDHAGITISNATNVQHYPSVGFDGTNYLVVWEDWRNGESDIYGARISQSGIVFDPDGFAISTEIRGQYSPSVAFDSTNYLVVWTDGRSGSFTDIYAARINQIGQVLDPNGIDVSIADYDQGTPSVAIDGTNYLVVWTDGRSGSSDIYGTRVNQGGTVLDPTGIAISTAADDQRYPSVAFDGTNYLVVWEDSRSGSYADIYSARVNQVGVVLDTTGFPISIAADWQGSPSIAFDITNYLVVWQDGRNGSYDIYGARVNQAGTVLDSAIAISTVDYDQGSPSVAFDGTNYLVVWKDERSSYEWDIYGSRVNRSGVVLDQNGIPMSTAANWQESPSVTFDGTNYFVVWTDGRSGSSNIYGARVNQAGIVLDPAGISISTTAYLQGYPSVTFDGTNYLVVWIDGRNESYDIYGARVNQSGLVLDSNSISISTAENAQYFPSVAFDGTNYLVVWEDWRNGESDIYGARISRSGTVLDPEGFAISTAIWGQRSPSVAFDETNYLVVWSDNRPISYDSDIYGARVTATGTVLEPNGICISDAVDDQEYPAVTFGETNYLVVWIDGRSVSSLDIYGTRVNQSGSVLDAGIPISTAANEQFCPSVAFDGTNFLVVWEDLGDVGYGRNIYGAKVNLLGLVIDSFPIITQIVDEFSLAIACGIGYDGLIAYSGWTGVVQGKTYNTMRIWCKLGPFPGIKDKRQTLHAKRLTLDVYPNPTTGVVRVRGPLTVREAEEIKILDVAGKVVREIATPSARNDKLGEIRIPLKGINPGIYFLTLGTETKKFIVTR